MYKRSELRHACYRAKNNAVTEQNKVLLDVVESLLSPGQTWDNFTTVWDLLVNQAGEIKIIRPESSYDYIHSTLLEASLYAKQGIDFDSFSDRQMNIITQVESIMLDGVMSWKTYNKSWGVELDPVSKQINTKLYDVPSNQKEVTQEMIWASQKDADGNPLTPPVTNVLEARPMTEEQTKQFEEFLKRKYPNKG